jgi:hypothetical protein
VKTNGRTRLKAPTRTGLKPARRPLPRSADGILEAPARREQPGLKRRRERVAYLDNLKLLLVAVIIAGHGALAYGDLENAWPYQDVREVHLAGVSNVTLAMVVIPAALFAMGLLRNLREQPRPSSPETPRGRPATFGSWPRHRRAE